MGLKKSAIPYHKVWLGACAPPKRRKGKNVFVHQLANAQINSRKPVTLKVLNEILAYSNILVSEDTLNSLLTIPK